MTWTTHQRGLLRSLPPWNTRAHTHIHTHTFSLSLSLSLFIPSRCEIYSPVFTALPQWFITIVLLSVESTSCNRLQVLTYGTASWGSVNSRLNEVNGFWHWEMIFFLSRGQDRERKETSSSLFNGFVIQTKGIGGILLDININIKVHKILKTCQISIVLLHLH